MTKVVFEDGRTIITGGIYERTFVKYRPPKCIRRNRSVKYEQTFVFIWYDECVSVDVYE